jgi:ribA/ribD-fused uncharacterized protein
MVKTRSNPIDEESSVSESDEPKEDPQMDLQAGDKQRDATFPPVEATGQPLTPEDASPGNLLLWMRKVSAEISQISLDVKTIKDDIHGCKEMASQASNLAREAAESAKQANDEVKRLSDENIKLKNDMCELSRKLVHLESQSRRDNLLFDGISEGHEYETWAVSEQKVKDVLKQMKVPNYNQIQFERVHRMGDQRPDRPRTIIAKFSRFKDREAVWQCRFSLKQTKIYISEDYPQEIAVARQKLYPALREGLRLRKDPQSGIKSISLRQDTLFVNNKKFNVANMHNLPKCLQPEQIATREDSKTNVVAFYSRNSIFSNLNTKFPFVIEGKMFNCPEQYYHSSKAHFFNDTQTAEQIMSTVDPYKQLQLGKTVKNYVHNSWMQRARQVLTHANRAKYEQNKEAMSALLATGNATLAEASPNKDWGIGIRLHEKNCTNPNACPGNRWPGKNWMGKSSCK